jgi:hypothetical protein
MFIQFGGESKMPVANARVTDKRFAGMRESSATYGDKDLFDMYPSNQLSSGERVIIMPLSSRPRQVYILGTSAVEQMKEHEKLISDWPKRNDPSTQEDLLDSEDDQVKELILRIRMSIDIPYKGLMANRLVALFNDAKEEDSASPGIAIGSLRNFYNFLRLHTDLEYPVISLTPECNIYASWRKEQKKLFSVHFLPSGNVRFVIFMPNDRHPEQQIRISGTTTTDILKKTVAPHGVWGWISNER